MQDIAAPPSLVMKFRKLYQILKNRRGLKVISHRSLVDLELVTWYFEVLQGVLHSENVPGIYAIEFYENGDARILVVECTTLESTVRVLRKIEELTR